MTIELDQLASRAANDAAIADPVLNQAIIKAIETTRRYWKTLAEEQLPRDTVIPADDSLS